ncbi:MAG: alternative ribosome rescue aminoacyl-tRNA hydrolase ArfB [Phycisphaerae bacterium]
MPLTDDPQTLLPWVTAEFSRSGGPGGQNVNKVSSRVTLRFAFELCDLLTAFEKSRIRNRLGRRIGSDATVRVNADSDRSQLVNREAALERLHELLREALHVEATRTATRPTRGSQRRRVNDKRQRGDVKRGRRSVGGDE